MPITPQQWTQWLPHVKRQLSRDGSGGLQVGGRPCQKLLILFYYLSSQKTALKAQLTTW